MSLAYSLNKLLKNQQLLPYFIHYLDASGGIELIQFLMHLQSFYSSFDGGIIFHQDAEAIFSLFIDPGGAKRIEFPVEIVNSTKEELLGPPKKDIFKEAELFAYNRLETCEFSDFREHLLYKKHELEVLQSEPAFSDLIHIEVMLQVLLELISMPEDKNQLQFILACDAFEDEYWKSVPNVILDDAMGIYDRYISLQATVPLQITSSERLAIESAICQADGVPSRRAFRPLHDRLAEKLSKKFLTRLKQSRAFANHLEELASLMEGMTPRSSVSEASGSPSTNGKRFSFSSEQECMLGNGTSSTSKASTLAQVDSLGRYKPMFDEKRWHSEKKKNKLKAKLTGYLTRNAAKEEEEANEAAMAIIQDVQRMVAQRSFD